VQRTSWPLLALLLLTLSGCRERPTTDATETDAARSAAPPPSIGPPEPPPPPKKGMLWIPPGPLVAGTPPEAFPRVADEEIPGEQLILKGFYIDVHPYPNEEGAIPLTNVSRAEAEALCARDDKRLCSELEWERACKGPNNTIYEYGNTYRADRCGTGVAAALRPSGLKPQCRSEFGVFDLHGGVWEWTQSPWGRGSERELTTIRGGNATAGELVGRCANGAGRPPGMKSGIIGFRCCAGARNEAEVTLQVVRGKKFESTDGVDKALAKQLGALMPEEARREIGDPSRLVFERGWIWRPVGNEELQIIGGCSGLGVEPACGILIVRIVVGRPVLLAWASSGHWAPMLHAERDPRDLWLFGGDDLGQFKRLVAYVWGKVSVGERERRVPRPRKAGGKKAGAK
jgi:formylglycine-generating enzyme